MVRRLMCVGFVLVFVDKCGNVCWVYKCLKCVARQFIKSNFIWQARKQGVIKCGKALARVGRYKVNENKMASVG